MIKKIKHSLVIRMFLITFAILLAVSGITYGIIAWTLPVTYVSRLDRSLEKSAQKFINELQKSTLKTCDHLFQQFRESNGASAALEHPDGTITFPGLKFPAENMPDDEFNAGNSERKDSYDIWLPDSDTDKRYAFTFSGTDETYYLLVGGKTEAVNQVTETLFRILPLLVSLILGVSLLTALGYSRYLAKPVIRLSRTAQKMAALNFSTRCDENRSDEIGMLGKNLNELSKKLSATLIELQNANQKLKTDMKLEREQERRRVDFFSAVSHELKTPITVIKGQLEGMLQGVGIYKNREKYLARSLAVADSMESLVAQILSISRMESSEFVLQEKAFDFSELVREQLARYIALIEQKELAWDVNIQDHLIVTADRERMGQVLSNLLSNAVLYSPAKAALQITVCAYPEGIYFAVENTGVHIPEEEFERLFEAFYRLESSRNRRTGGSGLGLYFVSRVLRLHESECQIQNTKDGVRFSFTLSSKAEALETQKL